MTWTNETPAGVPANVKWGLVASDASGQNLVVASSGLVTPGTADVWMSTNGGATWTDQTTSGKAPNTGFTQIASSASGRNFVACRNPGDIWTYASAVTGAPGASLTLVYAGNGEFVASSSSGVLY